MSAAARGDTRRRESAARVARVHPRRGRRDR
jgi:hypothetical protein